MGSKYYGEQNYFGTERSGGSSSSLSSSSSKKGKKNSSDKPKQPQRGLGVAQLEKIRLHSQLGCTYLPSLHNNPYASTFNQQEDMRLQTGSYTSSSSPFQTHHGVNMMGLPADIDRSNLTYGESQPTRWHPAGNSSYGSQHFVEPNMTQSFFESPIQGSGNKKIRDHDFMGSSGQNSDSNNPQEIDLELRLSL